MARCYPCSGRNALFCCCLLIGYVIFCVFRKEGFLVHNREASRQTSIDLNSTKLHVGERNIDDTRLVNGSMGRIFYNRVPKCGSRTVITLLKLLSRRNGFNFYTSSIHNKTQISLKDQMQLVKYISSLNTTFIYERHIHYIDFEKFDAIQPVYINIIRDPIDRFVSNYYFRRFGDAQHPQYINHSISDRYLTLDECVLYNKSECSEHRLFYVVPYFCGQDPRCRKPTEWSLERALFNLDKHYLLVGFLEKLEETLQALELLLPDIFHGAVGLLNKPAMETKREKTVSYKKTLPSDNVRQILRSRMGLEYAFYEAALRKFNDIMTF
ncbi:uronyl 2-sulfotransferase-like [Saccoglossus kowalevskii]